METTIILGFRVTEGQRLLEECIDWQQGHLAKSFLQQGTE